MEQAIAIKRFPTPSEVKTPDGAEGWEEMYSYYILFSEDRAEDENKFWFCDTLHHTVPLYPFDAITAESWGPALGQYNARIFMVPPALGIEQRILNGYLYISPVPVCDSEEIRKRMEDFSERAGFYYKNWDKLYGKWKNKVTKEIEDLKNLKVPSLPEKDDEEIVKKAVGISTGCRLLEAYNRLIESVTKIWQYHFEFLNLGYVAFLDFSKFMKEIFPDISDLTITQMVAGIDVILFEPDKKLIELSELALKLNLKEILFNTENPSETIEKLEEDGNGRKWLKSLESVKDPWFYFNSGTGFYHTPRSWIDDLSIPFSAIRGYIRKLEKGEKVGRSPAEIKKEAEKLEDGYYSLLKTEKNKKAFIEKIALARKVFPYVEEHNFYVEHWHHTVFWNKVREFGMVFFENGFIDDVEDIFYLNRFEISQALNDLYTSWGIGSIARGPKYWPAKILKRKEIIQALQKYQPVPALGTPPEEITEPFTIMLWGVVSEKIEGWLEAQDADLKEGVEIKGHPASPGIIEGLARVVMSTEDLDKVEEGEIIFCPVTAPSWTPIFPKISAIVTNVGGLMSHAAIIAREYEMPAVVGTGLATQLVKTGQRVRVNGNTGEVELL
ncbi:MAG: hypothetical protein JW837_12670 [Sedimentisphaerales bacterium]|nr:hypothetical protein [Sedimentisphaerales bacterium]